MTTPYRLSFTTGGLFVPEAPVVVACYFTHRDWQKTRDQVRQDKLLQVRTDAAATRISKELVARLELLATHDYVLLKWFDLLMDKGRGDQVRFHVLSRDADSGQVRRDSMDDYRAIEPNAIADTFNELTKEQVARKMGGLGK